MARYAMASSALAMAGGMLAVAHAAACGSSAVTPGGDAGMVAPASDSGSDGGPGSRDPFDCRSKEPDASLTVTCDKATQYCLNDWASNEVSCIGWEDACAPGPSCPCKDPNGVPLECYGDAATGITQLSGF